MCKRVEEGISFSLARGKEKEWRGIRYNRKEIYVDGKMSMFEVENFEVRNKTNSRNSSSICLFRGSNLSEMSGAHIHPLLFLT